MKKIFLILSILLLSKIGYSQFTEFHPELDWYTIKGKHVEVHYHNGAERTAEVVAKIADEVWEPICSLYDYEPTKVHYIIKDIVYVKCKVTPLFDDFLQYLQFI